MNINIAVFGHFAALNTGGGKMDINFVNSSQGQNDGTALDRTSMMAVQGYSPRSTITIDGSSLAGQIVIDRSTSSSVTITEKSSEGTTTTTITRPTGYTQIRRIFRASNSQAIGITTRIYPESNNQRKINLIRVAFS